jgi:hypothetical protein
LERGLDLDVIVKSCIKRLENMGWQFTERVFTGRERRGRERRGRERREGKEGKEEVSFLRKSTLCCLC